MRITEECNLKCTYCYAKNYDRTSAMPFDLFQEIIVKIKSLPKCKKDVCILYLSGGEPLLHSEFENMLAHAYPLFDRIHILSNGLLLEKNLTLIKKHSDKTFVQISVDGDEAVNDQIRGNGTYRKAESALKLLKQNRIKHWISYTVSKQNRECGQNIVNLARNTDSVFNNITPYIGSPDLMLDFNEWEIFKNEISDYAESIDFPMIHSPNACGFNYKCGEYFGGITFNPNGSVTGCARNQEKLYSLGDLPRILIETPKLMNETCMREKWKDVPDFKNMQELRERRFFMKRNGALSLNKLANIPW